MSQVAIENPVIFHATLPTPSQFPVQPATWYLFCRSSELRDKPVSKTILGHRMVAFRDSHGNVSILDAHCAHLGADLGRGRVRGDCLQCPFHHWSYSQQGKCVSIPQATSIPDSAKLRVYPAVERHGYVFFFLGSEPLFPLPFFSDCDPDEFVASQTFTFPMDAPWFMLVGNGFDGQHFQSVHDRKLTGPPVVDCPDRYARRMRFDAEVVGHSIFDRLLKRFVGKFVRVSITSWGGPFVLVEGKFGRAHSRLLVASRPVDPSNTLSHVMVFAKKSSSRLFDHLSLRTRRRFTQAFLQYDIDKLRGVRYQPAGLTPQDAELIEYFRWVADLPRSDYEELAP
ncbi:Rieske 2Fe-2S domain-containing protein [Aeoliella sp.]|uniref:Rieske 2Fe-2S domain-containing protein n=1 Tax=Aeoliella sp. TaxID=2795800 RepID=UPI003CCBA033